MTWSAAGGDPRVRLSRRRLLGAGAGALAISSLAGCVLSSEPAGSEGKQGQARQVKEAPSLAQQVRAGTLPPLTERLPEKPLVVQPVERAGSYGGTWRTALLGAADTSWLGRTIGYEYLMRWNPPWTKSIPNVAESVTASSDAREFTIVLRKGMKWSDGEPMTADDLMFAWNDVLGNKEITPAVPSFMLSGEEVGTMEKVDGRTVSVRFSQPSGLFEAYLSFTGGPLAEYPRHYLKDFHAAYAEDADGKAKSAGFAAWPDLLLARADLWSNKDLPRMHAWILRTELGAGNQVVAERNPYYFKVDPDGRQLPYIDKVVFDVISDDQVILLKATNGEIDFSTRHINTPPNKPVLARGRDKGGYHFIDDEPTYENEMIINLNLTHRDPATRKVFQNKDFRIALSHAINREELIKTVYQAQAKPWQAAPREESEFYDEEMAHQYLEHDLDKANAHLDAAGYSERDGEGFRLRPDGKRLGFTVEVAKPALIPFWTDGMELVVKYWKEIGVDARIRAEDRSLFYARIAANRHDAAVWTGFGGLNAFGMMLGPRGYVPMNTNGSRFAVRWAEWFVSRGETGERPPEATRRQMELYRKLLQTPDSEGRKQLLREILQIAKEQFYTIGTLMATSGYGIASDKLHNIPKSMVENAWYNTPAPTNPEQYFMA